MTEEKVREVVQLMIDNNESPEDIKRFVKKAKKFLDSQAKEGQTQSDATVTEDGTASTSATISLDSLSPGSEDAQEIINSYQDASELEADILNGTITNQEVIDFYNSAKKEAEEQAAPVEKPYVLYDDTQDKHNWLNVKDQQGNDVIDKTFFDLSDDQAAAQLSNKYPGFEFKPTNNIVFRPQKEAQGFNVVEATAPNGEKQLIEFNVGALELTGPKASGYSSVDEAYDVAYNDLTSFINKHSTEETDKKYLNNYADRQKKYREFDQKVSPTSDEITEIDNKYLESNPLFDPEKPAGPDNKKQIVKKDLFKPYEVKETSVGVLSGMGGVQTTKTVKPYEKELKAKRKELGPKATEQDVQQAVVDDLIRKDKKKIKEARTTELLDTKEFKNFEKNQGYALAAKEYQKEYNSKLLLQGKLQDKLEASSDMEDITNLSEKFNNPDFEFQIKPGDEVVKLDNGKLVPLNVYNEYQSKYKGLEQDIKDHGDLVADLLSNIDMIASNADQLDLLRRNYNGWEEFGVDLTLMFGDMMMAQGYGAQKFGRNIMGVKDGSLPQDQIMFEDFVGYRNFSKKIRDKYKKDIVLDDAFKSWSNFGSFAAQEVANQIPIFTALAMPGGVGFAAIGGMSFGDQYADMELYDLGLRDQAHMEHPNFKGKESSQSSKFWSSLGYAAADVGFGAAPSFLVLRNIKKGLGNMPTKNQMFNKSFGDYIKQKQVYTPYLTGVLGEPIGEGLTMMSQNAISGRPLMYMVKHAMFSGLMFGKTMATVPFIRGAYYNQFSDFNEKEQIRILRQEQNDLGAYNIHLKKGQSISETVQDRKNKLIADNDARLEELQTLIDAEVKAKETKVKTLSNKAAEAFINNISKQEDVRIRALEVQEDPTIPADIKSQMLDLLSLEFNNLQEGIEAFKKSKTYNSNWHLYRTDKKNKIEVDKLLQEAEIALMEQDGVRKPDLDQINDKARILYNTRVIEEDIALTRNNVKSDLSGSLIDHNTVEQTIAYLQEVYRAKKAVIEADETLTPKQKKELIAERDKDLRVQIQTINEGGHGLMIEDADRNLMSIINIENMAKDDRLETKTHELQHVVFASLIGTNDADYKDMSDAILDWTQKNNKEAYERILTFTARKEGTNELSEKEVVALFMEEVAAGNIDLNTHSGFAGLLGYFASKSTKEISGIDIDLGGETDAVKFLVGLANKIKNDQLTMADFDAIKKNQIIKGIRKGNIDTQFSKSEYKELFTPEQLAEIIKDPRTDLTSRTFAEQALVDQFDLLALSALNYDTRKGDIRREDVLAEARAFFPGILNRFNPATSKFSTYVTSNMRPKQQQIYEATKRLTRDAESINREGARQIADDVDIDNAIDGINETNNKPPKTNVLNIGNIRNKKADILKNVKVKEGDSFKEVLTNNTNKIGEIIFDVPGNKITDPAKNLTYAKKIVDGIPEQSEAGNIQNFFNNKQAVEDFIKILPKENVTEQDADVNKVGENIDVQRDIYGNAIGLPNSVLKYFYEPKIVDGKRARSKGKTSQVKIWKLKDKFVGRPSAELIAQVQRDIGITPRGQLNLYNRTPIGQLLKGVAKTMAMQATLSGAQRNLAARDASPLSISRITAAQSKMAFSQSFKVVNIRNLFELETKGVDKLFNLYELEKTFNLRSKEGREGFIKSIEKDLLPLMPKDFWFGPDSTVFTASNKAYGLSMATTDGKRKNKNNKYKKPEEANAYNDFRDRVKALKALPDDKFGKPIKGVEDYSLSSYSTMFKDEATIKKNLQNGKIEEWNKKVALIHEEMWKRFNKAISDDYNKAKAIGSYLKLVANDTGHWHKLGAQFVGYSKEITGARFEYEHAMPATSAYLYLLDAALSDADFNTAYDLIVDSYKLIALDKAMDKKLTAVGLQRKMPVGWSPIINNWFERYFNDIVAAQDGGIDPKSIIGLDGRTFDQIYNVNSEGKALFSKPEFNKNLVFSKAVNNFRAYNKNTQSRGMSTFDFDETLIIDGENFVTATKGDDVVKIPSDKWPIDGPKYTDEGYTFDFSDFVNVRGGKEGPLLQKMKNQIRKYGSSNVFVLTARMQEAADPIHKWLKSQGINIPFENITGLGDSKGEAKAQWMLEKFSEGYNDMYFVDDALPNVKAVKDVLDQLDIKSKVVQAKIEFSKSLNVDFNAMLERNKGVDASRVFARVEGKKLGKNKGKFQVFVPPSAEDFAGLMRYFVGEGKQGDADIKFFEDALMKPFGRAYREMATQKQRIRDDYKALLKQFPDVKKKLGKMSTVEGFTNDNAVRVYLFNKAGHSVPGMSEAIVDQLVDVVNSDPDMKAFADNLGFISRQQEGYLKPDEQWDVGNIAMDLQDITNKIGRGQFLQEWINNKNEIFTPENLNKIEAVYGTDFRSALEDMLYAMETGSNRRQGASKFENQWNNWINNSVGAIMFFNARSAVLQTLSTVNFINFEDNNIFAAARAFANQKQYWSDFSMLFNSDFLKGRRAGLATNINEAELASAVAGAKNKAKAALQYLLKIGFTPTQIADSFAIASGGATFYRNRVKKYIKDGLSSELAEKQAMLDFQEIAEETQQSARPDRISQQQRSNLGRIILAFANTPLQYNRLIKKAAGDLVNKRGDWRSNVSRILYYGAIQNFIFASLQNALFAMAFDEEGNEEKEEMKQTRIVNSMLDSLLRGSGIYGAALATVKNAILEFIEQKEKGTRADYNEVVIEALQVSPPLGSKARKLSSAGKTYKWNSEAMQEMSLFDYDNPVWLAAGNVVEATTNIPMARAIRKMDNIREAMNKDNTNLQRLFLLNGWSTWDLNVGERVVRNEGKENEYVVYLDKRRKAVEEAEEAIDKREKEEKRKQREENQQRCSKIKSDGERCKIMVNKPKTRCHYHD